MDRDKLVSDSPHVFGDIMISFAKHNEGRNWRRVYFNRLCWILILGVPLDYQTTDDLATSISKWGKLIAWENDPREKGRIIAKVRVTQLPDIPKSIRWSEGERFEEDCWASSVEIIHQEILGGGPIDEDPVPPPDEDPHPIPQQSFNGNNNVEDNQENNDEDLDEWEQDGHWALQQPNNNWEHPDANQVEDQAEQEEMDVELPVHDGIRSVTTTVSLSDGAFSNNALVDGQLPSEEVNQIQAVENVQELGLGIGMVNLMQAYHDIEDLEHVEAHQDAANVTVANVDVANEDLLQQRDIAAAVESTEAAVKITVSVNEEMTAPMALALDTTGSDAPALDTT